MNEYLILGMSVFWLVQGWLGAEFIIRRVRRRRGTARPAQGARAVLRG